jgi:aspartate--ammonia ligase
MEISSMGIRVDSESLKSQTKLKNKDESSYFKYHQDIKEENLPFTIGGGIGQSRLVMFILEKYHIGEFQRSF